MAVEIRITIGTNGVNISVTSPRGQSGGNIGQVTQSVNLGADPSKGGGGGLVPPPDPGGSGPGTGSRSLVIGPVVIDSGGLGGNTNNAPASPEKGGGGGLVPDPGPGGGGGLVPPPDPGGGGPTASASGAAAPVLVIGPIVIGATGVVSAIPVPAQNSQTPPAQNQ